MKSVLPVRYINLIKYRPKFLIVTIAISTIFAAIAGLLSPYLYLSSSVIQYQPKPTAQMVLHDDSIAFHKATMLVTSPQVLNEVAKTIASEALDPYLYFPRSIPALDLKTRFQLLLGHLGLRSSDQTKPARVKLPLNVTTSQIASHLRVRADITVMTITITYEAGDPEIALRICNLITNAVVALSFEMEKDELKRQEKYSEAAIARELEIVREAETGMRAIVEDHPNMAAGEGKETNGVTPAAQRYVKKQERLEKIDDELVSNHKQLVSIETDLGGSIGPQSEISGNILVRVTEELTDLEFRRLNSVKFGGYTEDHPSIYRLDKRIAELREVLKGLGTPRGTAAQRTPLGDVRGLIQQTASLREKNRALRAEKDVLFKSLLDEDSKFRRAVKVNFEYDSISRSLQLSQTIMNELYRDLQKIRLSLSGITASAAVSLPATYSPLSTNLSLQKRIFFATFVNIALILSLLILYEIIRPTLLISDDLRSLSLSHLGQFRFTERGFNELAACLWTVGNSRAVTSTGKEKRTISILNFAPSLPISEFAGRLGEAAQRNAQRVAVIFLDDPDEPSQVTSENVTVRQIHRADALLTLRGTVAEVLPGHDLVFIVETGGITEPVEAVLAQVSDHFVYLAEFGKTELSPIAAVRQLPELPTSVRHHSAVIEVDPVRPEMPNGFRRFPWSRKPAERAA